MAAVGGLAVTLVQPVRGDAVVGHGLHFPGAYLDFDGHPVHAHQHRVQGLVAIGLGDGDIVLELAGHRLIETVYAAQHAIAGIHRVDDDAKGVDVHDLRKGLALGLHLLVDAVQVFFPAHHLHFMAFLFQGGLDLVANLVHQLLAVAPGIAQCRVDAPGAHGVEGVEPQVLELHAHAVHAQAHGDGGVDIQCFPGDAPGLGRLQYSQGAHIVEPVGQLDQDDANIPGHGQGHFLEVLGLFFLEGLELHLGELADPVHQLGHGGPELLADGALGDAGVLYDIVQHGSHQ